MVEKQILRETKKLNFTTPEPRKNINFFIKIPVSTRVMVQQIDAAVRKQSATSTYS